MKFLTDLKKILLLFLLVCCLITIVSKSFAEEFITDKIFSQILSEQNDVNNSIAQYRIISKSKEKKLLRYLYLANGYVENGQIEKAIKIYKFVLNYKFYSNVASNLVYLLIINNSLTELEQLIDKYKLFQNQRLFIKTMGLLLKFQHLSTTNKFLKKYCKEKNNYLSLFLKGLYYEKVGDLDKALAFYEKSYKIWPSNKLIAYSYARLLDIKEKYRKAIIIYKQILNNKKNGNFQIDNNLSQNIVAFVQNRLKQFEVFSVEEK